MGLMASLPILAEVRETTGLPVLTDVHAPEQCAPVAEAVDVLQIPAFLCRQTDLLVAAGATGKPVNIKKGQFLAPWDMKNVAGKVASTGNEQILLCERGVSFGYNTLVVDMRALPIMARDRLSGGVRRHPFGAAAGRAGRPFGRRARIRACAGARRGRGRRRRRLYGNPSGSRPCALRGPDMVHLKDMPALLETLIAFDRLAKRRPAAARLLRGRTSPYSPTVVART